MGIIRYRKQGKLGPIFIGSLKVIVHVGKVEYRMDLHAEHSQIHNTFQVSHLQKYVVVDFIVVSLDDIQFDVCLNYVERPIDVLDRKAKTLVTR